LRTDDFGWMRGAFDGASAEQKADWQNIRNWTNQCNEEGMAKAIAELKSLGIEGSNVGFFPAGSSPCMSVGRFTAMIGPSKSWDELQANEARARAIFSAFEFGAKTAKQEGAFEPKWGTSEAWDLLQVRVTDQMYRIGSDWSAEDGAPKIDPVLLPYLRAHMGNAMIKADRINTEMLKKMVEAKGWPTIAEVGGQAAANAWAVVQHADHDPAFQLKGLRLMEPLLAKGEGSKKLYVYLHDRVMLKLTGKQRFGTQVRGCEGTQYKLRPLENAEQVDKLRAEYGLGTIAEYRKSMGPCKPRA
jgi:hypothetical protein